MIRKFKSILTVTILFVFMFCNTLTAYSAGSYKTWLQYDSRWGSKTLGSCGDTMSEIGCAVTSIAMLVVHSGSKSESSFNPGTLCDYLSKNGGFDSYGNIYWGAVTGMVSSFTFEKRASFSSSTKSNITKEINNYINQGYYIILSVNNDAHWVAVDTVSNGEVLMMDPAQNSTNKLFSRYDASGIYQARLYKGKNAPNKTPGSTPSSTQYKTGHYKTTDALNLRASYSTSSNVLLTIPKGKTIVVTRVHNNEWGQVEYNGKTGWICMEYLTYISAPAVTTKVTTSAVPKTTTTTLKTTVTTTKATTTTAATTATLPLKGDINRDCKFTSEDLIILNRYLANPYSLSIYDEYVMDINGDSLINELDAVYLLKKIKL